MGNCTQCKAELRNYWLRDGICTACRLGPDSVVTAQVADDPVRRMRITHLDWRLIAEALEMLETDYDEKHPEQARLNALALYARMKGWGNENE